MYRTCVNSEPSSLLKLVQVSSDTGTVVGMVAKSDHGPTADVAPWNLPPDMRQPPSSHLPFSFWMLRQAGLPPV